MSRITPIPVAPAPRQRATAEDARGAVLGICNGLVALRLVVQDAEGASREGKANLTFAAGWLIDRLEGEAQRVLGILDHLPDPASDA